MKKIESNKYKGNNVKNNKMATARVQLNELNSQSPKHIQIKNDNIRLKNHQLALLYKCIALENDNKSDEFSSNIGVIADNVGSGKSYVILALMEYNKFVPDRPIIKSYGNNNIIMRFQENLTSSNVNILVIPHNLACQWGGYVNIFDKNKKCFIVNTKKTFESLSDINSYDLIIVTATWYHKFATLLQNQMLRVNRVVYDEVDNLSLTGCLPIETKFCWFVTASYINLLFPDGKGYFNGSEVIHQASGVRSTGYIRELFKKLSIDKMANTLFNLIVIKNSDAFVEESMELPKIAHHTVRCKTPYYINVLDGIADKALLERLNANDIDSALQFIDPRRLDTENSIIQILINKYKKSIRNLEHSHEYIMRLDYHNEDIRTHELNKNDAKKKELLSKIRTIEERITNSNLCCICFDDVQEKTIVPCCSNAFCFKCINFWLLSKSSEIKTKTCPYCKENINGSDLYVVRNDAREQQQQNEYGDELQVTLTSNDKITNFFNIFDHNKQRKMLLFSNYENTFENIIETLASKGIANEFLKGPTTRINKLLNDYRHGDLSVLMVNPTNFGCGLNLENTTDIVMFHRFSDDVEKQIIGRAQRSGRTCNLNVWYLMYSNETKIE